MSFKKNQQNKTTKNNFIPDASFPVFALVLCNLFNSFKCWAQGFKHHKGKMKWIGRLWKNKLKDKFQLLIVRPSPPGPISGVWRMELVQEQFGQKFWRDAYRTLNEGLAQRSFLTLTKQKAWLLSMMKKQERWWSEWTFTRLFPI